MKRIAFVTPNYTGATLPIVKQLLSMGYHVDYYIPLGLKPKNGVYQIEAMYLHYFHAKMGLHEIPSDNFKDLYQYMGNKSFRIFYYRTTRPFKNVPIFRNIMSIWRRFQFVSIMKHFKRQNYCLINLIGDYYYNDFLYFYKFLAEAKIITSLHEVCNHCNPNFNSPSSLLTYLFKSKKNIVVHSLNSLKDILKYKDVDAKYISHINFGIFETYKTIYGYVDFFVPCKYILYFGTIKSYKGLPYLLKAIKHDPSCLGDCKLIIAGNGTDDIISEFEKLPNVIVINRYIKNEELIYLIEHCLFVVCPYTSMSQSGLPQTIFAFNKPIVASDLDGFREIVSDGNTGLLFKSKDAIALNTSIRRLVADDKLYSLLVNNIKNFENLNEKYSWTYITQQYLNLLKKV